MNKLIRLIVGFLFGVICAFGVILFMSFLAAIPLHDFLAVCERGRFISDFCVSSRAVLWMYGELILSIITFIAIFIVSFIKSKKFIK